MAMVRAAAATRRRRQEGDEPAPRVDRVSDLPDGILADIVSRLPAQDGARTQVLSTRWRPLWRAAPLNLDLGTFGSRRVSADDISRILAAHPGPGRRFLIGSKPCDCCVAMVAGWLQSPALRGLQELEFHFVSAATEIVLTRRRPPLPALALGFFSTLRVASFGSCRFPGVDSAAGDKDGLRLPRLEQLTLSLVVISEPSMHALLAGCRVLRSLLLDHNSGCRHLRFQSATLRSIGIIARSTIYERNPLEHLIIQDAPSLERLIIDVTETRVSVISAPKLKVLGPLDDFCPTRLELGNTVFEGLHSINLTTVVHSVRVLALENVHLSLDLVLNFVRCFPCLEQLYIQTTMAGETNVWCRKYRDLLIGTLNICLKKIVIINYRGNRSHVNFVKFFVWNAKALESVILELRAANPTSEWIERQHKLLQLKDRASRGAQFDFVCRSIWSSSPTISLSEQVHDLSIAEPFVRVNCKVS